MEAHASLRMWPRRETRVCVCVQTTKAFWEFVLLFADEQEDKLQLLTLIKKEQKRKSNVP